MTTGRIATVQCAVFAAAIGILGGTAAADTITVKKGDDLQAAIDGAKAGDTIVIRKGTYGPVSLDGRSDLTIKGKGKPVIDGSSADNCLFMNACQRIVVTGVVMKNSQVSAVLGRSCDTVQLSKCVVLDAGDEGIEFADCERITLDRNRIDGTQDDGIACSDGSGEPTNHAIITRNSISNVPDGGIDVHGDDNLISKNRIRKSRTNGVRVGSGTRNVVEKNQILKMDGVGVDLGGDANEVNKNKIVKPTGHGIDVVDGSHKVVSNVVTKSGGVGIRVGTDANEVRSNKVSKSATFDLQDTTGGDTNTFTGNKVKTLDPSDLPNPRN